MAFLCLASCLSACTCEDDSAPDRSAQAPLASDRPTRDLQGLPPPEGQPLAAKVMAKALPDSIGAFRAKGISQPVTRGLPNGGTMTVARRIYVRDGLEYHLQVSDLHHSPEARAIFDKQREFEDQGKETPFYSLRVQGRRAMAQHFEATNTAIVNVLIEDRVLANIKVTGVPEITTAAEMAESLPLDALTALVKSVASPAKAEGEATAGDTPADETAAEGAAKEATKDGVKSGQE